MERPPRALKSDLFRAVIDAMDTRNLDLGLLVTLEALLAERNVTRAARRLNLSQPALSARLARLREALGDPLLIPAQRGMVLTQRALELMQPLHEALDSVRRVVEQGAPIDPATMQATLVIAASDYVQYALLARFAVALRVEAPMVRIAWRALDVMALSTQLERGEVDLALAAPEHAPAAMRQRRLYEEDYAVIARRGHPTVQGGLNLDVFCAGPRRRIASRRGLCRTYGCSTGSNWPSSHRRLVHIRLPDRAGDRVTVRHDRTDPAPDRRRLVGSGAGAGTAAHHTRIRHRQYLARTDDYPPGTELAARPTCRVGMMLYPDVP